MVDFLAGEPRVSVVVADDDWWGANRLPSLNGRQRVAANLVREACAEVGFVDWLFFIDGDEVALVEKGILGEVPDEFAAVRLRPLESVADGGELLFKRLLEPEELRHLKRLGLLHKASNSHYFHGHVSGKVGVRPTAAIRLGVHAAEDVTGMKVATFEHPELRHLHFESLTLEEFVRKWTALAASGPAPGMRPRRAAVLNGFIAMAQEPDPRVRRRNAEDLYRCFVADDAAALQAAGVLERIDLRRREPGVALSQQQRTRLNDAIARHSRRPKTEFLPRAAR